MIYLLIKAALSGVIIAIVEVAKRYPGGGPLLRRLGPFSPLALPAPRPPGGRPVPRHLVDRRDQAFVRVT